MRTDDPNLDLRGGISRRAFVLGDLYRRRMGTSAVSAAEPRARTETAAAVLTGERAAWALVGVGALLRISRYVYDRSLWGDEARLALNLRDRGFGGLVHSLSYIQAAPTGFLLAEKTVVRVFGDSEYAMRLIPLLAGLASLALFVPLARRLLPPAGAIVAIGLYAVMEPLVYYSSEVKQYSLDVLATVALLLIATPALLERRLSTRRALALLFTGATAFWFSHPSIFVAASIWLALTLCRAEMPFRRPVALLVLGAVWLAVFAASYELVLRNARGVSDALGLGSSASGYGPVSVLRQGWHSFAYPDGFAYTTTGLAVALACIGAVSMLRRTPAALAALAAVVVTTFLAAVAGRYPFYDRFLLFMVPIVLLLVAAGLDVLGRSTGPSARFAGVVMFAFLVAYPAGQAAAHLASPPGHEEVKPVLKRVASDWRTGDSLYVSRVAQYPVRYYAECKDCGVLTNERSAAFRRFILAARGGKTALHSVPPRLEVGRIDFGTALPTYVQDFRRLRGRKRAWFIFTSTWDDPTTRRVLDCMGHRLESVASMRAAAYLYDLAGKADATGPLCPVPTPGG